MRCSLLIHPVLVVLFVMMVGCASIPPEPEAPAGMITYYMGIILKGPSWSPEETPERAAIQEAHMENIRRLGKEGKLVLAGPFIDDGTIRGIFVFKCASLEEAQALTDSDPAVKAGRLEVEIHPWMVPKGVLP